MENYDTIVHIHIMYECFSIIGCGYFCAHGKHKRLQCACICVAMPRCVAVDLLKLRGRLSLARPLLFSDGWDLSSCIVTKGRKMSEGGW